MCGRTVFTLSRKRVVRVAGVNDDSDVPQDFGGSRSYNLGPTKGLICVTQELSTNRRCIQIMKWGIDPRFETEKHLTTINARMEGVASSKMYSGLIDTQRCVVIVDGFYEWTQDEKIHTPYLIRYRDGKKEVRIPSSVPETECQSKDGAMDDSEGSVLPAGVSPLLFAAIYDRSKTTGENKCSIITMESFGCASKVHSRMPLLLSPDTARMWLEGSPFSELKTELSQTARKLSEDLQCIQVSTLVNSIHNQSRDVTLPIAEAKKRSFEKGLGRFFKVSPEKKTKN